LGTSEELKTNTFGMRNMVVSTEHLTAEVIADLHNRYSRVAVTKGQLKISHKDLDFKEIVDYLHSRGVILHSAALEQPTLEDVFVFYWECPLPSCWYLSPPPAGRRPAPLS